MTARIQKRLTAAVAFGLLFAVHSELPADVPAGTSIGSAIEWSESLEDAHLFTRGMQISRRKLGESAAPTAVTDSARPSKSHDWFGKSDGATSPHLFLGEIRLAARREAPAEVPVDIQPAKLELTATPHNPASESPFKLVSLPPRTESTDAQLRTAEVEPAARLEPAPQETKLSGLPGRQSARGRWW